MRAWLLDRIEGLGALRLGEMPRPECGPADVLLKVRLAALNPGDRYLAEGQYPASPPLPHILGRDALGTVLEVGRNVDDRAPGQRFIVLRGQTGISNPGTFADMVAVPADELVIVPPGWSDEEAAGATLVYLTAYQALTQWGELQPGVVLITGASGGVGIAALQLAKAMGHRVVALSRDERKRQRLLNHGATLALDPADTRWKLALKDALRGARVDLVIDSVGGSLLSHAIDTLGFNGRVSCVGRLAGPVPEFNTASLLFRRIRLGGVAVGTYTNGESHAAWAHILMLLASRGYRPLVDSVFEFEKLPEAFARLAQGPMGKVLLKVV